MGMLLDCNKCGHRQMISYNPVDGRIQWWTQCEKCKDGNFMDLSSVRESAKHIAEAFRKLNKEA